VAAAVDDLSMQNVTRHLHALREERNYTWRLIADEAGVDIGTVRRAAWGGLHPKALQVRTAVALLNVGADGQLLPGDYVDATGVRRMLLALALEGHTLQMMSAQLGWSAATLLKWRTEDTKQVPRSAAYDVAVLYARLDGRPNGADWAELVVNAARRHGALPRRYFTAANITDPGYRPLAPMTRPYQVCRRLRALARDGHGPGVIAACTGQTYDDIVAWTAGVRPPAYAHVLVSDCFERLSGRPGNDEESRARGIANRWPSCMAWEGVDIDGPRGRAVIGDKLRHGLQEVHEECLQAGLNGWRFRKDLSIAELKVLIRQFRESGWRLKRIGAHLRFHADPDEAALLVGRWIGTHLRDLPTPAGEESADGAPTAA